MSKEKVIKITQYEESGPFPSTEKMGKGMMEQLNNNIYTYNEKFTVEKLEEILTELSKSWKEKEKKNKEERCLNVYQEEGRLGFQLKQENHFQFYTGIGGFIEYYNINPERVRATPVKLNGIKLNPEQTEVFWKQFKIMKQYYEQTRQ